MRKESFLTRVKALRAVANRFSGADWIGCALHQQSTENIVATDAQSQSDLIAQLDLESLLNSGATPAEPEVHFPQRDAVRLRQRLALIKKLAIDAQGLSFKADPSLAPSTESDSSAALRAAANVAEWRTYLPADCVAAMVNDRWHWST